MCNISQNRVTDKGFGGRRQNAVKYSCNRVVLTRFFIGLALLCIWFAPPIFAGSVNISAMESCRWYNDASGKLSIDQVLAQPNDAFHRCSHIRAAGYTQSRLWIHFDIPPSLSRESAQWGEFLPSYVDFIDVYFRPLRSNAPWQHKQVGDLSGQLGDLHYRSPVIIFPHLNEGYEVVASYRSSGAVTANISVNSPDSFFTHRLVSDTFWGFYFGVALLTIVAALWLAITWRTRFLWLSLAFSASYLNVACEQGMLGYLFGAGALVVQNYLISLLVIFTCGVLWWLTAELLNMRQYARRSYWVLMAIVTLTLLSELSISLGLYHQAAGFIIKSWPLALLCAIWGTIQVLRHEGFRVRTLLSAAIPLLYVLSVLASWLSLAGVLPSSPLFREGWQYVIMLNMIMTLVVSFSKILDQKRMQDEAARLSGALQIEREANFHQRQFMGMVSHEYRTPLAIIQGALANLRITRDEQQRERRYEKIEAATNRLILLSDTCLADSRIAANKLELRRQPLSLLELLNNAAELVAFSDAHHLTLCHDSVTQDELEADPALLNIAISNILDNAVKYTDGGEIGIRVEQLADEYRLYFSDQGAGIPAADAPHIFERFHRGDSIKLIKSGTGLGLFLAAQIVGAHGGLLQLVENSAKGCTFLMTLQRQTQLSDG